MGGDDKTKKPDGDSARVDTTPGSSRSESHSPQPRDDAPREDDTPSVKPPTLALPKGGGAIRAIGEKFSANPATGAGSFSIPVYASPGRGGLEPALTVTYASSAGNGPFGLGFSLSSASIARRTDKRLPQYRDDDVFVLSGAEDLVPSSFHGIWTGGTRTVGNFLVTLYQPRVDTMFARIERWTDTTTGDFHWRSITKDNLVNVYGQSTSARIVDPDDPTRIFRWLIESTTDAKGNQIVYRYRAEDGVGVAPAIYEQRRRAVGVYLDRILYGNRSSTLTSRPRPDHPEDWLFELVFDYGERAAQVLPTPPSYAPPAPWSARQDPFSTYKPGFEVRTYRLCRRILMFHRLDDASAPDLVRATDFQYRESPDITFLVGATQTGYDPTQTPAYQQLPALALAYTQGEPDPSARAIDAGSARNLPCGLDEAKYRWVDLDDEGLSGVLTQQARGWFYKRNQGGATLGGPELVMQRPSVANLDSQQLIDLQRDGHQYLVAWGGSTPGAQARLSDGTWGPFVPFASRPRQDIGDPNARLIDLDGDGLPDLLVTEDTVLRWYPSLGLGGFASSASVPKPWDENQGPALVFADAEQSIHLADMSGDGLSDIVRIRNGDICYWPNLGFGRFGAKITMGGAPLLDSADHFDQKRIRLADVDGSGTTDLIYLDGAGARYWLNCAGNRFDVGHRLAGFPGFDSVASVEAIDLLGNGTSCLVWSSCAPSSTGQPMRYLALTGGLKPHLLQTIDNGRGATTTLTWRASTEFYVADRRAGTPWVTRLPFPVQVVAQVDVVDAVTGDRLTTRYVYHHGFYDGVEREFRGFGMVEQFDAEAIDPNHAEGASGGATANVLTMPPIHTKTWFHTGAFLEGPTLDEAYAAEYYQLTGVFVASLPDCLFEELSSSLDARQATRALAGMMLRQEIYADDGAVDGGGSPLSGIPFTVTAHNYHVKALQAATAAQYGIYITRPRETLTCHLERDPSDPRFQHDVVIAGDDYGNVTDRVTLAYPRRTAMLEGVEGQDQVLATYRHDDVTNVPGELDWYRVGTIYETRTWEVRGFPNAPTPPLPLTVSAPAYTFAVVAQAQSAAAIAFESSFDPSLFQRRLIADAQVFYRADDGSTELPLGQIASRGLLSRNRRMAFSPTLLNIVFDANHVLPAGLLTSAGYELDVGQYWARSASATYGASIFYQPNAFADPFGNSSSAGYDAFSLFVTSVTDALSNTMSVAIDSRTLQPRLLSDVNGNQSLAAYDPLGRLVAIAVQGKPPTGSAPPAEGDTLASPTTQFSYHLESIPSYVVRQARETAQYPDHAGQPPDYRYSFTYYDGFGREVMTKVEDDDGQPATQMSTKWVGTGRTVFNNKGKPVKQYEPYFASTNAFESEQAVTQAGVTDVLTYDPLDRLIRVDHPNGTFALTTFDVWTQSTYDENDTLAGHGPNAWWTQNGVTPPTTPQQVAAVNAYEHRDTPMVAKLDVLGRTVDTRATNVEYPGGVRTAVEYPAVATLDIQGNSLATTISNQAADGTLVELDALTQTFDMLGRVLTRTSSDAGQGWTLADAIGKPVFTHDARATTNPLTPNTSGYRITWTYDALRRPVRRVVHAPGAAGDAVAEQFTYGEGLSGLTDEHGASATPQSLNLLGRLYRHKDGAGVVTNVHYDLRGNLIYRRRQLIADYTDTLPDWSTAMVLDVQVYANAATFDVMSRALTTTHPDGTVIANSFGKRMLLVSVAVTPAGRAVQSMVTGIDYNEKGQRKQIRYGNGTATTYSYELLTFRISTLSTVSPSGALQGLTYYYDPVGNIAEIDDSATATVNFNGGAVSPNQTFVYDALYRLTQATGREQIAQTADQDQLYGFNLPAPTQPNAFRGYTEKYTWDRLGNFRSMQHAASVGGGFFNNWTRHYETDVGNSNRLLSTSASGSEPGPHYSQQYAFDGAGNITRLPYLGGTPGNPNCIWNDQNRLIGAALNVAVDPVDVTDRAYYSYDAEGTRVRKVVVAGGNVKRERRYLGGYEVFQHTSGGAITERHTVHVMDDKRRVALVETKTIDNGTPVVNLPPVFRYQMDNQLASSLFELDAGGNLISREEYHPFGTTSFYLEPSALLDVDIKRYRYTGRERDDETGLYRLGARYYLPWLGRFLSADPAGYVDGANLYRYSRDNPIRFSDPSGTDPNDYQLKSQLLFTGIANPLTLPDYPSIPGASAPQTFELVGSQGANLGFTGSGGSTSLLANYRQRVSERLDLGVTAAYAGQYPWTGGDSTNSNFTGSQLAFFSHFGDVENQALTQTSSGFYFSAGFLWGQGPAGATDATNPFASLTTGLSTFRRSRNEQGELDTDFQLDWNLILTASRYGNSINNRVGEGAFSALTVFNFALPADFNVEVAGGPLVAANPIPFDPNDPHSRLVTPFTLRSQLGVGWTHQIGGNYVVGIEAILTKDWLPSVVDSSGNQAGPLGLTVNIGISGVNRPHHPQDENAELQRFIQERDDAMRGGN